MDASLRRWGKHPSPPVGGSDEELVEQVIAGDPRAFDLLFDRHQHRLVRICARIVDRDRAQDIVQDAFERAYRWLAEGCRPDCFEAWITRVARNLAIDEVRRPASRPHANVEGPQQELPSPIAIIEQRENVDRVLRRVRKLPERQRRAFVAREIEQRSFAEIAEQLETSEGNVRKLTQLARDGLRQRLGPVAALPLVRSLTDWLPGGGSGTAAGATVGGAGLGLATKVGLAIVVAGTVATGAEVAVESASQPPANHRGQVVASVEHGSHPAGDGQVVTPPVRRAGGRIVQNRSIAKVAPAPGATAEPDHHAVADPASAGPTPAVKQIVARPTPASPAPAGGATTEPVSKQQVVQQRQAEVREHQQQEAVRRNALAQERLDRGRERQDRGRAKQRENAAAGEQRHEQAAARQQQQAAQRQQQAAARQQQAAARKQQKAAAKTVTPPTPPPGG